MHPVDTRLRLSPDDEYMHAVEAASNFNESMYCNLFDHGRCFGGWFRLGNRPNEGHAEMSCCLYLPDGRVGFMYQRPELQGNDAFDAGGMRFEVVEPFRRLRLHYRGMLCLLDEPQQMEKPREAFAGNPIASCEVELECRDLAPPFGGEPIDEDGRPLPLDTATAFARGHYEQHMAGGGRIRVGDAHFDIEGFGLRDHSWGPRYWQNIHWYRWLPLVFGDDLAMMLSIVTPHDGAQLQWGVVMARDGDGAMRADMTTAIELQSAYDERMQAAGQSARIRTESGAEYTLTGRALSLIPLRNRRRDDAGNALHTRITEAMTEFRCNGRTGYGMAEYLDQMVDGHPAGHPA